MGALIESPDKRDSGYLTVPSAVHFARSKLGANFFPGRMYERKLGTKRREAPDYARVYLTFVSRLPYLEVLTTCIDSSKRVCFGTICMREQPRDSLQRGLNAL